MSFNIDEFLSEINDRGLAKQHTFDVTIPVLPSLSSRYSDMSQRLAMRAEAVDIPGRTTQTADYTTEYKPTIKIPYRSNFVDVNMTIILSENLEEKAFFEAWIGEIIGNFHLEDFPLDTHFNIGYWNNYISDIYINQKDMRNNVVYQCILREAYPTLVNPLQATWTDNNNVHKLQVTFSYRYFTEKEVQPFTYGTNSPDVYEVVRPNSPPPRPPYSTNSPDIFVP